MIAIWDTLHKQLVQQEQEYRAKYNNALKEYTWLKEKAAGFDSDKLMDERLAIRPDKERSAVSRMQSAYGNKYQTQVMYNSKQSVSGIFSEESKMRSVKENLQREMQEQQRLSQRKSRDSGRER